MINLHVRQIRQTRGLTVAELAVRAKLSTPNLTRIELGQADPKLGTLVRIAAALGVTVGQLLPTTPETRTPMERRPNQRRGGSRRSPRVGQSARASRAHRAPRRAS